MSVSTQDLVNLYNSGASGGSVTMNTSGGSGGLGAPLTAPTEVLGYTPKNESVADNINSVIKQNSPLMTQAKSAATRAANSRGLMNSSMAVNAGQDAVLKYATPIGSQQAQQNFQTNDGFRKYTYQADLTNREIASREKTAQWQLNSADANNTAQQMSNAASLYSNQIANINNNTNLSAGDRTTQIAQARAEYDRAMRLVEQIYQVDLAWA